MVNVKGPSTLIDFNVEFLFGLTTDKEVVMRECEITTNISANRHFECEIAMYSQQCHDVNFRMNTAQLSFQAVFIVCT